MGEEVSTFFRYPVPIVRRTNHSLERGRGRSEILLLGRSEANLFTDQ